MLNIEQLGWEVNTVGELDHQLLQAPHVKLRSFIEGDLGDVIYSIDLRINRPNTTYLSSTEMHSIEHFLLWGFRKYMPKNFVTVAPMGCQTGFYLVLLGEGNAQRICAAYENILNDVLNASEVPYANIRDCGNYKNHDVDLAKGVAQKVLDAKSVWRQII